MRPDRSKGSRPRDRLASNDEPATSAPLRNALEMGPLDLLAYQGDVLELTILFFDTLRRRANNIGVPPVDETQDDEAQHVQDRPTHQVAHGKRGFDESGRGAVSCDEIGARASRAD